MVEETAPQTGDETAPARLIDHVEVEVEVMLGEARLTVADLNRLAMGDILPIERSLADSADIRVNGRVIARGEIVTVADRFAVRVTEIGS
ncbi:flagellar motor switch protein FliN [Caenibius tardaugens NBRC 16725]|uniref:Flagellar motor switch protein FliN n=1 Tax=Caenibius tardaugens NBRC 16725 TaxID=1219035 RepID=U2ZZG2_9SPHN|nr:FliM/FliN family flagellar motor switch protein [Caenibius tardaugens]GAD50779.1 flagellar motor switch protein FliN [Caenibius tardaugens NBRC 16725]